jgi:MFS family permease
MAADMNRSRALVVLLCAKAISDIGSALDFVCLGVFVWLRTESALATGLVGLSLFTGGILGGRLSHRYGAHWNRRTAMIVAEVARAVALLILAVVPGAGQLWWLYPAVAVAGGGRAVLEATLAAATPVFAGSRLQLLNSVISGLRGAALIAGMALATVAVPLIGFRGVFALDAGSSALCALVLLALRIRLREGGVDPAPRSSTGLDRGVLLGTGVVALLAVRGLDAFGSSSHNVGLPILGSIRDAANPAGVVGAIWMVWATGKLLGSFGVRPLLAGPIARSPGAVFYVATALMSVGFVGVFLLESWPAILVSVGIAGIGDALTDITFRQALQRLPDRQRDGGFGLSQMVINSGFVGGLLLTGLVLDPSSLAWWVVLMHGVPVAASVAALGRLLVRRTAGPPEGTTEDAGDGADDLATERRP